MKNPARAISRRLNEQPLDALALYDKLRLSPGGEGLRRTFDGEMELLRAAHDIDKTGVLATLPQLRADARKESRDRFMRAVVARLIELASQQRAKLRHIGKTLEILVLHGSAQQQFCCKLATRLGLERDLPVPVRREIVPALKRALITVIEVGAPTTRDAAVEGLGALLKVIGRNPAAEFPPSDPVPIPWDGDRRDERKKKDYERRLRIRDQYFARLERRRLIVLTVAGHDDSIREFEEKLRAEIGPIVGGINTPEDLIADALYERQDLLRFLPGLARQRNDAETLKTTAERLRSAMTVRIHRDEHRPEVLIAFARFQESVFRTVDTAMRRKWHWSEFDTELAAAIDAIPRVLTGQPEVCNAQVRATVAILRAAIRVIRDTASVDSLTTTAMSKRFAELIRRTEWTNPGIAEGCYRGLPQLAGDAALEDKFTLPALRALFRDFSLPVRGGDFLRTHRRLIANSCFRRLLVSLTDELLERKLFVTDDEAQLDEQEVERDVRTVLCDPSPESLLSVCQHRRTGDTPTFQNVGEKVLASISFEGDALRRMRAQFASWDRLSNADRLLLTRILATQLHALSRDAPELARHDVLRQVLLNTSGVSMPHDEATKLAWSVLSSLPSDAARVADLEIQRYAEYSGRSGRGGMDDLPDYVLAMVPPEESSRIDSAIAREIDLTRRRDRAKPGADFAKALYQVTLRGPHETVFDHLIPRLKRDEQRDRQTALLFRRHVANVRGVSDLSARHMLGHVDELRSEIAHSGSRTLRDLNQVLTHYRSLFADEPERWKMLAGSGNEGGLATLFIKLDGLAASAHIANSANVLRTSLYETFKAAAAQIQSDVIRYMELPVGKFDARRYVLDRARSEAEGMRKTLDGVLGLQPPERIMLVSLMLRLEDFFTRTIHWFCDEPQHRKQARKEARDPEMFFNLFASPERPFGVAFRAVAPVEKREMADRTHREFDKIEASWGAFPAEFAGQRTRFEHYFVEWMVADLDVDMLQRQLHERWSKPFQFAYWVMTTFPAISTVILLPCAIAALLHSLGKHNAEGLGFLVLQGLVWAVALGTFIDPFRRVMLWLGQVPKRAWRWVQRRRREEQQTAADDSPSTKLNPYRREAVLLRLTRLIAVPMAFTVELEHAYEFPLHTSTWVLLLLILLSYITTRFFVDRELVDPSEAEQVRQTRASERIRVRQIVAVALSHAFMIAVLFTAIFGSHADSIPAHTHEAIKTKEASGLLGMAEEIARHVDHVSKNDNHKHPFFAAVLPRDVEFNTSEVFDRVYIPAAIAAHLNFTFYPTMILTWTALGLFVGVFLEGFVNRKGLRGGEEKGRDESH